MAPAPHPDGHVDHESVYDGLLGGDDSQWAFGTDFEDPLAGVDTTVPDGVDHHDLAMYCLMLADDSLVMSHRLAQWCSNAPDLEEDIALANIALDLLGQSRLLLARAAAADALVVPMMPDRSPVPPEDALAFFRGDREFRNVRLVEAENGDFGQTIARLVLFSTWRLALLQRLAASRDTVLSAVAIKGVKEMTYHRDYAARWFLTLAQGTDESRRRLVAGLDATWPLHDGLFTDHEVDQAVAEASVGVLPSDVADEVDGLLEQIFSLSGIDRPDVAPLAGVRGETGRDGLHTEAFSRMLAEMQVVARAHPSGAW
ncbi:1,2-phenylacetyl-CoA epoxidase subunit PaaC [Aeromicrobium sp.]|uniref:1,2-phenylacetyl-CoA epoxidase subunit PaaC n=1 Tax=Aeromicrobium sp. TaxID=1871063 RepID=UPI0019CC0DD3|nr:1,2-phenylacetyl-CoA epoxidase subunit PaaC [Aeromicrobium sp.]MBC7633372.1 phenylacetate-CoA oxygenase subunit PaaC [Aeromicrobium sp.]